MTLLRFWLMFLPVFSGGKWAVFIRNAEKAHNLVSACYCWVLCGLKKSVPFRFIYTHRNGTDNLKQTKNGPILTHFLAGK